MFHHSFERVLYFLPLAWGLSGGLSASRLYASWLCCCPALSPIGPGFLASRLLASWVVAVLEHPNLCSSSIVALCVCVCTLYIHTYTHTYVCMSQVFLCSIYDIFDSLWRLKAARDSRGEAGLPAQYVRVHEKQLEWILRPLGFRAVWYMAWRASYYKIMLHVFHFSLTRPHG